MPNATFVNECKNTEYSTNIEFQHWMLSHLGIIEYENPHTGAQGAISVWQVAKLIPSEVLINLSTDRDLMCNILEMRKKGWLKEINDPILSDDEDSRRFTMTHIGMLEFRKKLLPMAQMLLNQDSILEQKIQSSKAELAVKNGFIEKLKKYKEKLEDKIEDQAIDFIITTAKEYGRRAVPILIVLMGG
jgi:hypothetical protein